MLWHIIDRLKKAVMINDIIIATTTKESDKPIVKLTEYSGIGSYTGSEEDVLDRYYRTAKEFSVDVIVHITADYPLIALRLLDRVIHNYSLGDCDYASNDLKRTYFDGSV